MSSSDLAVFPHRPLGRPRIPASEFEVCVVQDPTPPPDRGPPQEPVCQDPIGEHRRRFPGPGGDSRVESGVLREQASFAARGEDESVDDVSTQDRRDRGLWHDHLPSSANIPRVITLMSRVAAVNRLL